MINEKDNRPRGIRNNNPGNIERGKDHWRGMADDQSSDPRFIVFNAPVWGLRAMARILHKYMDSGADTIREIINRWAPPGENDTGAYVAAVAKEAGVDPDEHITVASLPAIMEAIVRHENGTQPYAVAMFDEAIALERQA